ncbi:MAG: BON domain-containing protein [Planctomycetota bacterium]
MRAIRTSRTNSPVSSSGKFQKHFAVDILTEGGVVTLTGIVADASQKAELVRLMKGHPDVLSVRDQIQVASDPKLVVANYSPAEEPAKAPENMPPANGEGQILEPAPINSFQGGIMPYSDTPVMPPYAWPAYTPYNNFASMAYQTQYPSGAWPFIGPPHPYPLIPSGWRRVTLKWRGGYWWLKFHSH